MPRPQDVLKKDPDATLLYEMDWTNWLPSGETIATSSWTIAGSDSALTQDNNSILTGSKKTRVRLTAGTFGVRYTVTNRITTSGTPSQTDDRSFYLDIAHK